MTIKIVINEERIIMIEGVKYIDYKDNELRIAGDLREPAKSFYDNVSNMEVVRL